MKRGGLPSLAFLSPCCQAAGPGPSLAELAAPQATPPPGPSGRSWGAEMMGKDQGTQEVQGLPIFQEGFTCPGALLGANPPPWTPAHLGHPLHVQLHQLRLVHLQQGEAHPEDDLQALQRQRRQCISGSALQGATEPSLSPGIISSGDLSHSIQSAQERKGSSPRT